MGDHRRTFRVGLFVVVCGLTFVTLMSFIAGASLRRETTDYRILFDENVKGMVVGSKVNFQGVPIGAVHDIRFLAGRTQVTIRVDPKLAEIQAVTRARLDRLLVTGQVTVELEGFQAGAPRLPAEQVIPAAATDPIQELKAGLPSVLDHVDGLVLRLAATMERVDRLLSDDNLARSERLLEALDRAARSLPGELSETLGAAREALAQTTPLADDLRATLAELRSTAQRTTAVADAVGGEVGGTLAEGRITLAALRGAVERTDALAATWTELALEARGLLGQHRHTLQAVLVGAADAMRELGRFAQQMRSAPDSVLFGVDEPEISVPAVPPAQGGTR